MGERRCSVPDCRRAYHGKGHCYMHWARLRRSGTVADPPGPLPVEERLWAKVDRSGGDEACWLWLGSMDDGYGKIHVSRQPKRSVRVHRLSYELHYGPIPEGLQIDHRCHNRACVNPCHLQAVTHQQNGENLRGAAPGNITGVRGVRWLPKDKVWMVQVKRKGTLHYGGRFRSLEDAERAAVALRNSLMTNNLRDRGLAV